MRLTLYKSLTEIAVWLWAGRIGWAALLTPPLLLLISWPVLACWESRIRLTGMLLELAGLAIVAWGLSKTRKLFALPKLSGRVRDWFRQFPRWRRDFSMKVEAGAFLIEGSDVAMAHGVGRPGPNATVEESLSAVQNAIEVHGKHLFDLTQKVDQTDRKQERAIRSESRERVEGDEKVRQRLEEAVAGGLHLEFVGVCWIALGIVLATASNEIASVSIFSACLR